MIALDIFRENIKKCWQFALDVAWDQNARHPELSRGKCLEERSYLHTLLGTNQVEVFRKACQMADEVTEKEQMNVLLPEVMQFVEEHKYPVTLLSGCLCAHQKGVGREGGGRSGGKGVQ